jgi:hypothetical protein
MPSKPLPRSTPPLGTSTTFPTPAKPPRRAAPEISDEEAEAVKKEVGRFLQSGKRTESVDVSVKNNRTREVSESRSFNDTVPEGKFISHPAHVTCALSITKNLDNYESAKISCSITRPCEDTDEECDRIWAECLEWVKGKIDPELDALSSYAG